ncbi:MAG: YbaK/EbsC family protein [Paraburkholderia sp.]|jgi:Ala-tRNA(Pro) deacylase|nr:YbaK/EbsC family protein [Paraburkholderia sp.]
MSMSPTLQACLRSKGSRYEVMRHPYSHSSMETAVAAHVPGDRLAKTVLLEDEHGYVAAVLPSTYAVQFSELWSKTGRRLSLATEVELRELFKDCDAGALPPVCMAYGMKTYLETSLAGQPDVYFEAGDHEELIHMDTDQFLALMDDAERTHFSRRMRGMANMISMRSMSGPQ